MFGDIVGVYTSAGVKIGTYKYDAWGNCTRTAASGTTALQKQIFNTYNPFRYRGYYYDVETQLYYLQSRYYDPATGRFLNADGYVNANGDLLGYNMYAYCSNNPVMFTDPTGEWTFSLSLAFSFVLSGAGYSFNVGMSFDSEEMCAIQYSYSYPNKDDTRFTAFGIGAGAGVSFQYTNYESVDKLEGPSKYAGVTTPVIGGNAVFSKDNDLQGLEASLGPTLGGDVHVNETKTKTVVKFPSLIRFIKNLLGRE